MPLTVKVVTAEREVLAEAGVEKLIVPGAEGELTILPRHAALITEVQPGEMRIIRGTDEQDFVITGGFMEVKNDQVTILADAAEQAEEIDVARAEAARQRASEALAQRGSNVDLAMAEAALRRSLIRLRVADRQRRHGGRTRPGGNP